MLLILGVLISSIACNVRAAQTRLAGEGIIGGVATKPNELKYQISLQIYGLDWCGGSIIDEQFVLTAAHCVIDDKNDFLINFPFKVVAGINDINDKNSRYRVEIGVEKVYVPTIYNKTNTKTSGGDIAVLKLRNKFDLRPKSNLIKLELPPSSEDGLSCENSYIDTEPLVSGFGWDKVTLNRVKTEDNKTKTQEEGSTAGKLLKAKALVIGNKDCQYLYRRYIIHDSQICARIVQHLDNVHQGVCSGDSGSPLALNDTIIGLVSYNYVGCDDKRRPAVYTRVSSYISFIDNAMEDYVTEEMRAQVWVEDNRTLEEIVKNTTTSAPINNSLSV